MVERHQISTTVTADAWAVLEGLVERTPYPAQTDVVSAALIHFGTLGRDEQLAKAEAVRQAKRQGRREK